MAVLWRNDTLAESQLRLDGSRIMHRYAGSLGYSTSPKRSSIDGRYYAEINHNLLNADGTYAGTRFNVAMGTGDTPVEAAADGYRKALPDDLVMAAHGLIARAEALIPAMQQRVDTLKRLDKTLDDLTALVRSVNVPRITPGEDDDL